MCKNAYRIVQAVIFRQILCCTNVDRTACLTEGFYQADLEFADADCVAAITQEQIALVFVQERKLLGLSATFDPKTGSYPVAGKTSGDLNGPRTGAILSLT